MLGGLVSDATAKAMLRRKPLAIEAAAKGGEAGSGGDDRHKVGLKRSLTLQDLILYGVGCSVGAGIYALVGIGAELAGPGISLSFLCCGVACVFTALAYAEFAARVPVTGSAYSYAYVAFGEFCAWMIGWNLTLNYAFSASVVARSWGEYLAAFVRGLSPFRTRGVELGWLTRLPLSLPFVPSTYTCSPLSTVIIGLCTLVLVTGAKESSRFNNAMTVLNLFILAFVVVAGVGSGAVETENLTPFLPEGLGGVARGAGLVFFAFIGFDMVACLSEEVVEPERNMPRGIIGSLVVTTGIYLTVALVVLGMAPFDLLGGDVPIVYALLANGCCTHEQQLAEDAYRQCLDQTCSPVVHRLLLYGSRLVSFGSIFGLTTGTFTSLMGQPRIFYKMAQDGLFFKVFGKINERTQVPTAGIVLTGILCAALAAFVQLEALANLISLGVLQVFTFVDVGVIILRMRPTADLQTTATLLDDAESGRDDDDDDDDDGDDHKVVYNHKPTPTRVRVEGFVTSPQKVHVTVRQKLVGTDVFDNGSKPVIACVTFTTSIVLSSMTYNNRWNAFIYPLCIILAITSAALLMVLPKSAPPDTFQCPYVPVVPMLGVAFHAYMMGSLPLSSWFFSIVWLSAGVVIYFLYGIKNSTLHRFVREGCTEHSPLLLKRSADYTALERTVSLPPVHQHET